MSATVRPTRLALDLAVPVFNEEVDLERAIRELHRYLTSEVDVSWQITIADNASTDETAAIADRLAREFDRVSVVHISEKGRGLALKRVWLASSAAVVAYVDVDLSTELSALPPLIAPLLSGHSDIAIGTRLAATSRVVRGRRREFISRSYNLIVKRTMDVRFSDAQCGFKAMRSDVARQLIPLVEDNEWFFDTELLIIAEKSGLRIHEVPVDWIDDPNSSVDLVAAARADLVGLWRVARSIVGGRVPVEEIYAELGRAPIGLAGVPSFFGQAVRFAAIGLFSTLTYALLYIALQWTMPGQEANFLALIVTAVLNTGANRRFTFGVRGRVSAARHHVQGLVIFGLAWALTAGALAVLHQVDPLSSPIVELAVLTGANLVGTALRFVLLRAWVFRRSPRPRASVSSVSSSNVISS